MQDESPNMFIHKSNFRRKLWWKITGNQCCPDTEINKQWLSLGHTSHSKSSHATCMLVFFKMYRKDKMLHAWRDFWLLLKWEKHWSFEISCLQNPQYVSVEYDSFQMAAWWRAGQKLLSSLWIHQDHTGFNALRDQDENAHQNKNSFISSRKSQFVLIGALDLWLKCLFEFTAFTVSKRALEMTFKTHRKGRKVKMNGTSWNVCSEERLKSLVYYCKYQKGLVIWNPVFQTEKEEFRHLRYFCFYFSNRVIWLTYS